MLGHVIQKMKNNQTFLTECAALSGAKAAHIARF